ncbi:hypothetical protein AVEN_203546-1 [Araneus ventricosus]|uniref:Uncharacterized protein n=1 Tax=Araneus ventricosus TaxID=182803 RepID=A0A4Y2SQI2_ARAVE|nr:hypothetical protein AVEN_203546-1 [Araneus ventricosus]
MKCEAGNTPVWEEAAEYSEHHCFGIDPRVQRYFYEEDQCYRKRHFKTVFNARPSPRVRSPAENAVSNTIGEQFTVKEESAAYVGTDFGRPREEV